MKLYYLLSRCSRKKRDMRFRLSVDDIPVVVSYVFFFPSNAIIRSHYLLFCVFVFSVRPFFGSFPVLSRAGLSSGPLRARGPVVWERSSSLLALGTTCHALCFIVIAMVTPRFHRAQVSTPQPFSLKAPPSSPHTWGAEAQA